MAEPGRRRNHGSATYVWWGLIEEREAILGTRSERVKTQFRKKYADKNREDSQHMRTLYGLTKTLCNERSRRSVVVLDKDGNLISGKEEVQRRWSELFKEVLNREELANPSTVNDENGFEFEDIIEDIASNDTRS